MTAQQIEKQQNALIVKRNDFIEKAKFSLSMREYRFVNYLISKIKPGDSDFKEYEIDIKEFCEVCKIDYGNNLTSIKDMIKKLRDKSIWAPVYNNEKQEALVAWIESPVIEKDSGVIKVSLNKYLKPYLLDMKKDFTQYKLKAILALQGKYSVRLYELFKRHQYKGIVIIKVEDLRKSLMIENEYPEMKKFKHHVIDNAVEEINFYTDLDISYKANKTGRKITSFTFFIEEKPNFDGTYPEVDKFLEGKMPSNSKRRKLDKELEQVKIERLLAEE